MPKKNIIRIAVGTLAVLLIPFFGNIYVDGWDWNWYGFVWAGTLLFAAGLIYELVARKMDNRAYKLAVGLAVGTGFILSWTNMIRISETENLLNSLYFGMLIAGFIATFFVRFKPRGMAWVLFGMAAAQVFITVILLTVGPLAESIREIDIPDVLARNTVFSLLWISSALLFRRVAKTKIIFVDAVECFVSNQGEFFREMRVLLDSYSNRKIILTGADEDKFKTFGLDRAPYEVFTLRHNPEKTDSKYYEILLKHFRLGKNEVVYFEHDPEAVKSAESVGINSYFYDNSKKDLRALKEFLDKNI